MKISNWPAEERPREKLLLRGATSLSDAELLAIFLRTGLKGKNAVDLARELLQEVGGLRALLALNLSQMCQFKGLGAAKSCQIQAALEMAQRHLMQELKKGDPLMSPELTRDYLKAKLRNSVNEQFACIFLDNKHRVITFEILFTGSISSASIHPRVVVQRALQHNAAAVIFAHNHPSGVADASHADISITHYLQKALELIEVRVLDHLIIGEKDVESLAEQGHLLSNGLDLNEEQLNGG